MSKPNNPPAFPFPFYSEEHQRAVVTEGMTLRDYFAAKAMQAFIREYVDMDSNVKKAYEYADAMLAEREKGA